MLWLSYAFYGLMVVLGGIAFVLCRRAKLARAWIWLAVALVGVAGVAAVAAGHTEGKWRRCALGATFALFALDHLVQYVQSRRAGSPKKIQLGLAIGWLALDALQFID